MKQAKGLGFYSGPAVLSPIKNCQIMKGKVGFIEIYTRSLKNFVDFNIFVELRKRPQHKNQYSSHKLFTRRGHVIRVVGQNVNR